MTQHAHHALSRPSKARTGAIKTGNSTPQHAIMELKHRILTALGKLADRDTQQIAMEELDKIVDALSADCVSVCLSCLYDSEMPQKSVVKKECVRLFGSLASLHGDLVIPHLPKIIGSIMRRLRDPDSSVRDACVDAMGILSSRMISSPLSLSPSKEDGAEAASSSTPSPALTLATFSKPLFDALSEQNKSVQTGAAMCLARVIESARDPPLGAMSRLCPRICKFMSNPNFVARPALLAVIGSLSQVGAIGQAQLSMVVPCVHEALGNNDWATRKAAAETLTRICSNPGYALESFRLATLRVLESCRFDKVKPVRDSVLDAVQLWKSLPGMDAESPGATLKNGAAMEKQVLQTPSPTASERSLGASESSGNGKMLEVAAESQPNQLPKILPEKALGISKKKISAPSDKRLNPDFFQKISAQNTDDWDIEVAVPHKCSLLISEVSNVDGKGIDSKIGSGHACMERSSANEKQISQGVERYNTHGHVSNDEGSSLHSDVVLPSGKRSAVGNQDRQNSKVEQVERRKNLDKFLLENNVGAQVWDTGDYTRSPESSDPLEMKEFSNEANSLEYIHKQLLQLEQQQSSVLRMVQEFIMSSQETTFALQTRVRLLEKVVEEMAFDSEVPIGRNTNGSISESNGVWPSGKHILGLEYPNRRDQGAVHINRGDSERDPASEGMGKSAVYKMPFDSASEDWDDHSFGNLSMLAGRYGQLGSQQKSNGGGVELARTGSEDIGADQLEIRRVWDKVGQPGPSRRGEGPSARSVWQASNDEATLAAIRVAGEDAEVADVEGPSSGASRLVNLESERRRTSHGTDGQEKNHWSLWTCVLEFLLAGDVESAYAEVLCAEDELILVRLMSRTGPILDQLTVNTASEVLHAVGQLLQHQTYADLCVSWIQQVVGMVVNDGADCLELSEDAKKELLLCLHESLSMVVPEDSAGATLEQLLQLLMDAWSINIEQFGCDL